MHSFSFNCWVLIVATITSRAVLPSLFILVSSVCKSLQCLISSLTQGGKGGHIFRLTCSVVLWGGRNTANKPHWRVWGVFSVYGPHWFVPAHHGMCFCGLHCSGSKFLCRETVQSIACVSCTFQVWAAQVQILGYCAWAQTWLGVRFVPFPGLSSSGGQVLGECSDKVGRTS